MCAVRCPVYYWIKKIKRFRQYEQIAKALQGQMNKKYVNIIQISMLKTKIEYPKTAVIYSFFKDL